MTRHSFKAVAFLPVLLLIAAGATAGGPTIVKKGVVALDLCETTPFVFQDRVYRMEWARPKDFISGHGHLRIIDRQTGEEVSRFGASHRFPCAYVEGKTVYVVGTTEDRGWHGTHLTLFTSRDLKNWTERRIFTFDQPGICNTSLCKAGDRYVMCIERALNTGFPARFIASKDLEHWELLPPECRHDLGRYNAPHCLRFRNGWYYLFYLEANRPGGYEQFVTRSRDLMRWEPSRLNPVLAPSKEDKLVLNAKLSAAERATIAAARDCNNSDLDFCEYRGRLVINYSWGNQVGAEFLAEAEFDGSETQFLEGWFPPTSDAEPKVGKEKAVDPKGK